MTPKMLEQAGKLLFGQYWRMPFEDRFSVSNRTLRRMLKGEQNIPAGLVRDMEMALRDHANAVDEMLGALIQVAA